MKELITLMLSPPSLGLQGAHVHVWWQRLKWNMYWTVGTESIQLVKEGILKNKKEQLTNCKLGRQNKFGYGSIIFLFFLYTILIMSPLKRSHTRNPLSHEWSSGPTFDKVRIWAIGVPIWTEFLLLTSEKTKA